MSQTVLVFSNSISGLFTFRKEVMKAIVDAGFKVYLVGPEDDPSIKSYDATGCQIINIAFSSRGTNPFSDMKLLITYLRLIRKYSPKVVLTYTIKPNIYGGIACRLRGIPQIANITGLGDAVENEGWLQRLTIMLCKIGLKKARKVFFQNKYNCDYCIRKGIFKGATDILPGSGVNLAYHTYQKYPIEGPLRFLFIGRCIRDKGAREYLAMAKAIGTKYSGTRFDVLGMVDSEYSSQLHDLEELGISKLYPSTNDVRPYLKEAICTIMPSYHEGMSNVNLESAANGRPVITSNVPGCRETIDDGITGFLAEARDTKSLCNAVERFIALPYSQKVLMGENARKKVEKEFDRQIVVDAYLNEIESIPNV